MPVSMNTSSRSLLCMLDINPLPAVPETTSSLGLWSWADVVYGTTEGVNMFNIHVSTAIHLYTFMCIVIYTVNNIACEKIVVLRKQFNLGRLQFWLLIE